jgi:DNA segregation ATPase FtsK/SpoIIIE, S-DNA-T family
LRSQLPLACIIFVSVMKGLSRKKKKKEEEEVPRNRFRERTPAPEQAKSSETKVPRIRFSTGWLANPRVRISVGLFLFAVPLFIGLSGISYLWHWQADQSLLALGADASHPPKNLFGLLGARIAHLVLFHGPGIATFILIPIPVFYGMRLLLGDSLRLRKPATLKLVWLSVWLATVLGFLLPNLADGVLAGRMGFHLAERISLYIGPAGTSLLLFVGMIGLYASWFKRPFLNPRLAKRLKVQSAEGSDTNSTQETEDDAPLVMPKVFTHRDKLGDEQHEPAFIEDSNEDFGEGLEEVDTPQEIALELEEITKPAPAPVTPTEGPAMEMEVVVPESVPSSKIAEKEDSAMDLASQLVAQYGEFDPRLDLAHFQFPSLDLLESIGESELKVNKQELEDNKNRIVDTLRNYGVEIQKIKATIGPTVTLYEIVPAPGVRIAKIKNLEDDIALSLAAHGIRIIAPIPGKGTIGIEVPNQNPSIVGMRPVLEHEKFASSKYDLPIALGRTISNEVFVADLAKMPHLLVAGATGQGKSVGINTLLVSLLYKKHPTELKFVMVDPKKVELTLYSLIEKHYLAKLPDEEEPIITDTKKVVNTLNSLCIEMDNRYELLKNAQARNLKEYNQKFRMRRLNPNDGHRFLPYIVLVVDEFADLIMTAGKEVELPIARLAQLARAIGIHLIIATQRPSVNIITGTIKANFPARLAFRVTSKIDSRTILDAGGADQLIGRGDMLLSLGSDIIRLQCPFVDTPEVERIVNFIADQRGFAAALELPEYVADLEDSKAKLDPSEKDSLFEEAAMIIVQSQQGSASLLQRRLNIGYARAGRLIDQMESAGIVGATKGSKPREVLVRDEMGLRSILDTLI